MECERQVTQPTLIPNSGRITFNPEVISKLGYVRVVYNPL